MADMIERVARVLCLVAISLSGCDDLGSNDPSSLGTLILYDDGGLVELSAVHHIGSYCWVSWYHGIEKVLLRGDGTAVDGVLSYKWTLDVSGPKSRAKDSAWFKQHCLEPPDDWTGESP